MKKEYLLIGLAILVIGIGAAAAGGRLAQKSAPSPAPETDSVAAAPTTPTPDAEPFDDKGGEREDGESDDGARSATQGAPTTPSVAPTAPAPTKPTTPSTPAEQTYSLADVAAHATESSCWSAINGSVYDLTEWIRKHPGGSRAILGICGKDGSSAFNGKHGESEKALAALPPFKIGALRN